mgnify:CR=1 FL=1
MVLGLHYSKYRFLGGFDVALHKNEKGEKIMGWEGIGDLIGTIAKWWTPEKVKARARQKLAKLKEEENDLLSKGQNPKNTTRLLVVRRDISRLQTYCGNN